MADLPSFRPPARRWCFLALLVPVLIIGCRSDAPAPETQTTDVGLSILDEYEIVVGNSDAALQVPAFLEYDPVTGRLFVYDHAQRTVFEIDSSRNIVRRYGGSGKGPGEIDIARNLFLRDRQLYVYDPSRFFIYRYERESGDLSSFKYGAPAQRGHPDGPPPPPPAPIFNTDIDNEMTVTLNGNILKPVHNTSGEYLYERVDWEGNHLSWIGELPTGDRSPLEQDELRKTLENNELQETYLHQAFPVNNRADSGTLYMVYSTVPKVAKYDTSGRKLWEREIPHTPEIDTLVQYHVDWMGAGDFERQVPIRKYFNGFTTSGGELYLVVYNILTPGGVIPRPWVHRFSPEGELLARYTFAIDDEPYLIPFLAVDPENNRFLVISLKDAEIRAYPF